jgi:hypothetical protein
VPTPPKPTQLGGSSRRHDPGGCPCVRPDRLTGGKLQQRLICLPSFGAA